MKNETLFITLLTGMLTLASTHTFAQTTQARQESKTEQQEAKADRQRLDDASALKATLLIKALADKNSFTI